MGWLERFTWRSRVAELLGSGMNVGLANPAAAPLFEAALAQSQRMAPGSYLHGLALVRFAENTLARDAAAAYDLVTQGVQVLFALGKPGGAAQDGATLLVALAAERGDEAALRRFADDATRLTATSRDPSAIWHALLGQASLATFLAERDGASARAAILASIVPLPGEPEDGIEWRARMLASVGRPGDAARLLAVLAGDEGEAAQRWLWWSEHVVAAGLDRADVAAIELELRRYLRDDDARVAHALSRLGKQLVSVGRFDLPRPLERAVELAAPIPAASEIALDAINALGLASLWAGRFEEARQFFERVARETTDLGSRAAAVSNLGRVRRDQGDLPEAQRLTESAVALLVDAPEHADLRGQLVGNLAEILRRRGSLDEAERCAREGLALRETAAGRATAWEACVARVVLARVLHDRGRHQDARAAFKLAWATLGRFRRGTSHLREVERMGREMGLP